MIKLEPARQYSRSGITLSPSFAGRRPVYAWSFSNSSANGFLRNLVPGPTVNFLGGSGTVLAPFGTTYGLGGRNTAPGGNTQFSEVNTSAFAGLSQITLISWFVFNANALASQWLTWRHDFEHTLDVFNKTSSSITWGADWKGTWNGLSQQTLTGLRTGDLVCIGASINSSGARFFHNGRFSGTKSGSAFTTKAGPYLVNVVAWARMDVLGGAAFGTALSDGEMLALTQNPWQIFRRAPSRIFVGQPATTASGAGLSSLTFSASATGTVLPSRGKIYRESPNGDLRSSDFVHLAPGDGGATFVQNEFFGPQSGAASGTGTSSLTFSVSAVGASTRTASGSSSLTFVGSGVGSAVVTASGASSLAFNVSGVGASTVQAAGASSVSFVVSGASGASGNGAGSSSLTFSVSGVGASRFDGVGSSSLTFTASAVGSSGGNVGAATLSFTASAVGSSVATATGSANLGFNAQGFSPEPEAEGFDGGFWAEQWRRIREKKPTKPEVVTEIQIEEIAEEVREAIVPKSVDLSKFIQVQKSQIETLRRLQELEDEDDIEVLLLL